MTIIQTLKRQIKPIPFLLRCNGTRRPSYSISIYLYPFHVSLDISEIAYASSNSLYRLSCAAFLGGRQRLRDLMGLYKLVHTNNLFIFIRQSFAFCQVCCQIFILCSVVFDRSKNNHRECFDAHESALRISATCATYSPRSSGVRLIASVAVSATSVTLRRLSVITSLWFMPISTLYIAAHSFMLSPIV